MTWVDLDRFYGKVKFGTLGFWMENVETLHFSVTVTVSDTKMQAI